MEDRYDAVDIVVERSKGLTVTFADEHVAEFNLMRLRLACPCATCRSLRERGQEAWPTHGSPARLQITTAVQLGGMTGTAPASTRSNSCDAGPSSHSDLAV